MGADSPLNRLVLKATSVADDVGYVALNDLSRVLGPRADANYRVIGGHMVTILVARWQLGAELYRETGDADLGVPPVIARDVTLVERLANLGYQRRAGNRFARTLNDVPVRVVGDERPVREAVIDILVPAYTSRVRQNRRFGEHLVTTEVPGLAIALRRSPLRVPVEFHRLNGETLESELSFPDEVGALLLKSLATRVRHKATDIVDIWRCLEVAYVAGVKPGEWADGAVLEDSAAIVRSMFDTRDGRGMRALVAEQRLSERAADKRHTRLRAVITRVLGPS